LIKLTGEDGKNMVGLLYDINQDFKNSQKQSGYTIIKGKYISFMTEPEDIVHNIAVPKLSKKRQGLEQYIESINGYVDGGMLFSFFKENKKFATDVELYDDYFVIKTSIPEVEFKSASLRNNLKLDIEPYKEFQQKALKFKNKKHLIGGVKMEKEQLEGMQKNNAPIIIESKGVKFKATHKLFLGLKAKSEVKVMFFELDKEKNLYLVDIVMDNPHFKSENYFVIVNF
jgi:23S rRNA G2069 N7-methylase RlmK/C1962 C5-methylase RlmI